MRRAPNSWTAGSRREGGSSAGHSPMLRKSSPALSTQYENESEPRILPTLKDVGPLLDFLNDDDRPTIIVEEKRRTARVLYRNPAFDSFINRVSTQDTFDKWLQDMLQSDPFVEKVGSFCGEAWYSKPFRHAWRIMHCREIRETQVEDDSLGRRISGSNSQQSTWGDIVEGGRKLIDWTRSKDVSPNPWIQFLRNYHWETTTLGPITDWPEELRRLAVLIMSCPDPRMVYWGNDQAIVYNEAAASIIGQGHPEIMGTRFVDVWGEDIHARHMELVRHAIFEGRSEQANDFQAILEREGFVEETYWNIHLLPVPGPKGHTIAVINEYTESTASVFNEQRRQLLAKVNEHASAVESLAELWKCLLQDVDGNLGDSMYVSVYAADPGLDEKYHHEGSVGIDPKLATATVGMGDLALPPSLPDAFRHAKELQQLTRLSTEDGTLPLELAMNSAEAACILPISSMSGQQLAFVIVGLNPRRPYNEDMNLFFGHLSDSISKYAAIISLPEEQRQSKKFEELNLALTQQLRITALKAEKNEETFMRMSKNAPFGMYMYTTAGDPKFVNDSYLNLLSLTREEFAEKAATGLAWRDTVYHEDVELIARTWESLATAKTPTKVEYRMNTKPKNPGEDAGWQWVENISFPELDEEGNIVTIMGWLYDISHRKLTEALMTQRLEDALENKRASERFIDMTSHEIRNPLSSVLQLADEITHLISPPMTPTITMPSETAETILDAAQTILLCAQHQKNIVDDVLTISKLDSNLLVITPDKVDPIELIRKSLKMYEAELLRADIKAVLEVQKSYKDMCLTSVMLDPSRLLQVIINLLTNAIKFTKDLSNRNITIIVCASKTPPTGQDQGLTFAPPRQKPSLLPQPASTEWGSGEEVYLQFTVKDTGKGLTKDEMSLLFQRFSQGNPRTYKQYGGSGLGLFISKELTELQGGQIGVHSDAGLGSIFSFFIKAKRAPEIQKRPVSPAIKRKWSSDISNIPSLMGSTTQSMKPNGLTKTAEPLHVLIVEDNAINQRVMAQQLRRIGCIVATADHGLDALAFLATTKFYHGSANIPLSIVLMDLEMPVMDGLTCISRIRELERSGDIVQHVPVIAITANARNEQILTALDAGMDEVVSLIVFDVWLVIE